MIDIFNRICRRMSECSKGSIIEGHVLSFDDIQRLEEILGMKKESFRSGRVDCQCAEERMQNAITSWRISSEKIGE